MKVITTYIAFDGEEFTNEKDCLEHEEKMFEGTDKVKVYNANRLPIKNLFNHREFEEVDYLIVESLEHIPTIEKVFDFHDIRTPWEHSGLSYETGLYYWSYYDDEWHHWQTEMQSLTALGNYFQQFEEEENS